jgi:hypothetical protein
VSIDGGTFADATNEVTLTKEVGAATDSALGYITLTAAEMTGDNIMVQIKSANCVTALISLTPIRLVPVRESTAADGANGTVTLDAGASAVDDYYNGMVIRTNAGTGPGQVRLITNYVGSTKIASVAPNWATNPSSDTTYTIGHFPSQSVNAFRLVADTPTTVAIAGAVCDETLAAHTTADSLAVHLRETHASLAYKVVADTSDNTVKIYDSNGSTLLYTLTGTLVGTATTWVRS